MPKIGTLGLTMERLASATIEEHPDVLFTSLTSGDVLSWNGTNWVNSAAGGGAHTIGSHSDASFTGLAANDTLRYDGANWVNTGALKDTGTVVTITSATNLGLTITDTTASGGGQGGGLRLASDDGAANVAGDRLGGVFFAGYTTAPGEISASVVGIATGTWSGTSAPAEIQFLTTPTGSLSEVTRMTIKDDGSVVIGTDPTGSELLRTSGGAVISNPAGTALAYSRSLTVYPLGVKGRVYSESDTSGAAAGYAWRTAGAGADAKMWDVLTNTSPQMLWRVLTDDEATAETWLTVTRSGAAVTTINFNNGIVEVSEAAGGGSSTTAARLYSTQFRLALNGGDESNAGTIDYRGFDSTALSIVGAGTAGPDRFVRFFDKVAINTTPVSTSALIARISGTSDAFYFTVNAITTQTAATTGANGPVGGYFRSDINAPALTVARAYAVYIAPPTITAGTLTQYTGLHIDSITGAGTNIAISTGLGLVKFGDQVQSTVTTGTAPFIIASTTLVTNLNADLLDGNQASAFAAASHTHDASQIDSGTFADARIAQSNVTQHQAALSITEGQIVNGSIYARLADGENISGAWVFQNAAGAKVQHGTEAQWRMEKTGASANLSYFFNNGTTLGLFDSTNTRTPWHYTISGNTLTITSPLTTPVQITSTLATGTAPFSIASTTAVTNLNADLLDGQHASAFASSTHTHDAGTDITTGTLDEQRGGTGNNAYVTGDLLYATSAFVLARLAIGGSNTFLRSTGSAPAWTALNATHVDSGTFPGTTGYTFSSLVVTNAPAAGGAGFRLPHGSAPSTPTNGDFWTTTGGLFARINGATVTLATSANAVITNPSGAQTIVAASTSSASYPLELEGFGSSGAFQNDDSPPLVLRGFYWDGATSQPIEWSVASIITGAPSPTNTLTFKADGTARFTVTNTGKGWLGGPWVVGSDDGPPVAVNTQEVAVHDNTRQIGLGVDATRGLIGMRSNHEFSLMANNTRWWTVAAAGGLSPVTDEQVDIGTASVRVRAIYTHDLRLGGPSSEVGLIYHTNEYDNGTSGAGAKTVDFTRGNVQKITATGAATLTLTAPSGPTTLVLRIIANSTTAYTFTWPSTVKWAGGVSAPASPTTSGQWVLVTLYFDGTNYTASYTGATG